MAIVKPLIKSDLFSLLHFTTNGPIELFDKELLPAVSIYRYILIPIVYFSQTLYFIIYMRYIKRLSQTNLKIFIIVLLCMCYKYTCVCSKRIC